MRAFSQLLDDLVYTRSRNSKLKLIGDYLKETPDPDRGIALAALTGTLDIPAVKPAQVRAMAEERVDPVLLYMSRDYVGDMAETVSLLWPTPDGERCELDDGTLRLSDAVERLRPISRSDAPGDAGRDARPSRRVGPLRADQAGHRRAARRHLGPAGQAGAGRRVRARRRAGRGGVARAEAALSRAVRLGRGPRRRSRPPRTCRCSGRSCSPIRSTRHACRLDDYAAEWKWDGIRVQLVHAGGQTRLYSRTGDDISRQLPRHRRRPSRFRRCSTASCWSAATPRAASMAAPPASTRCSSGSAARSSARRCRANIRPSSGSTTSCSTARRICGRCPGPSGGRGWKRSSARLDPDRFDLSELIDGRQLRGAGGDARSACATRASRG